MDKPIGRRSLSHEVPESIRANPEGEVFFVTICCKERNRNQLATDEVWETIYESLRHRESLGLLRVRIALVMPDHLHGLFEFPDQSMETVIRPFKSWIAKRHGVVWQKGFFDHRIRGWEWAISKAAYIRDNPVRAGLVDARDDWKYFYEMR
ncbi:transposase [Luteolibacter algae]|uniref:Transposase n=1 Tax=Luteolibacter algae TaxID=454151 RepID=A0ABW5D5U7_9BACT